jgi:hypothetical protein
MINKAKLMKFFCLVTRYKLFAATGLLTMAAANSVVAQSVYQPYSYQFYQKLNQDIYSIDSREHTSIKPYFVDDSLLKHRYDSLMNYGDDHKPYNSFYRKLFNEHLIDIKNPGSAFYADLLPDFEIGQDFANNKTTSLTSLGFQIGGSVGHRWFYNVSGYASSAVLPNYLNTYVNQVGIIPGQAYDRTLGQNPQWDYLTAVVSYTPNQYLTLSAGRDKTFIGDGYRSMLLSDYASPYPFFKLVGTLGNVSYMAMWSYMNDPATTSQYGINQKKFGVFHYLDWNISKRLSIGFFENVIGYFTTASGVKRPLDFYYINPVIFIKPVNNSSDDPDKSLIGFTSKYKITGELTAYGQFALDEFQSKDFFSNDGSSRNKYGWQLGLRGTNLFKIKNLNYLIEANDAKPYTYSARTAIESYSENGEPLAHPWGANFRELVGLLNYTYKRFDFSGETDLGRYGLDMNGLNYGKDIFKLWTQPAGAVGASTQSLGNYTGQGLTTNLYYFQGKVAYILNPQYNLRIEITGLVRDEKNSQFNDRTTMLTIGIRSSFRELYTDVASYKAH